MRIAWSGADVGQDIRQRLYHRPQMLGNFRFVGRVLPCASADMSEGRMIAMTKGVGVAVSGLSAATTSVLVCE